MSASDFPVEKIRKDFPILQQQVHGHPLVYLDNAASTQMPTCAQESVTKYFQSQHANVHRGVHSLSQQATDLFEQSRHVVQRFIKAKHWQEIVWTHGTTESINLVAQSWGRKFLQKGDQILLAESEHHANIVPWQLLAKQNEAELRYIPLDPETGLLKIERLEQLLNAKTKIVSIAQISNVLGIENPIAEIGEKAHSVGAILVVDGAQSIPHQAIDVQALNCDFFAFSAHKMCGPTGLGVLYGKQERLEEMEPWMGGGEMIKSVDWFESSWNEVPFKFEAGTPPIAQVIAFAESIRYLENIGMDNIAAYDHLLSQHARKGMQAIKGLRIFGKEKQKSLLSFNLEGVHHFDLGQWLDHSGIAIRTGHHCAQPLMKRLGISGTARASFYIYNTIKEIDKMLEAIEEAGKILKA